MTLYDLVNNVEVQGNKVCVDIIDSDDNTVDHLEYKYRLGSVPEKYEDFEVKYIYPGIDNDLAVEVQEVS